MKKWVFILLAAVLLMGCGQSAIQSGFYQHESMYQSWDHMKFSLFGYRNPTAEDLKNAKEQGWWGLDVPYVPGM